MLKSLEIHQLVLNHLVVHLLQKDYDCSKCSHFITTGKAVQKEFADQIVVVNKDKKNNKNMH